MKILKAEKILDQIDDLYRELTAHQKRCKHIKKTRENKSDTGNYCPSDDSYWAEFECPTCLRKWSVDNTHPEYRE